MASPNISRRSFLVGAISFGAMTMAGTAVARKNDSTPEASPSASPEASPMASPVAGDVVEVKTIDMAFEPNEFSIPADTEVTIKLTNEGMLEHDMIIDGTDFESSKLQGGKSEDFKIKLPAGEYDFHCGIPGHKEAGMVGKIMVG